MSGGQLITVGQGTLRAASGGQVITSGQGILTAQGPAPNTVHISGEEATFYINSVIFAGGSLSGSDITSAAGTMPVGSAVPISGIEITSSRGTLIPNIEADDTYIPSGIGSVAATLTLAISGLESTTGQGTIGFSQSDINGSAATLSQQSIPATIIARRLTGEPITVGQGTLTQVGGTAASNVVVGVRKTYKDFYLPPGQKKKNEQLAKAIAEVAQKDPEEVIRLLKAELLKLGIEWDEDYGDIAKNIAEMEGDIDYELLAHAMLFMLE